MTRRWAWPFFALPGAVWLGVFFLVPFYAVLAVAFGTVDPIFQNPVPVWNPLHWQFSTMRSVLEQLKPGTRVVSNTFDMGDWKPEKEMVVPNSDDDSYLSHRLYLWTVPAREKK